MSSVIYRLAARVAHRLPLGSGKFAESVEGRRGAAERWANWARARRPEPPVVWFHAASVGEAQTAAPVLARLQRARPGVTPVLTASSPTLARWPHRFGAAHLDYVPLDEPASVARALETLCPSLLVLSCGDLWPELIAQTYQRQIPIGVIAARALPSSKWFRWLTSRFYRRLLMYVHSIGAVSERDAAAWRQAGAERSVVRVTGNPRHDAVLETPTELARIRPLLAWRRGRSVLVAGSVEPADEDLLLDAFRLVHREVGCAGMLVAPHEPTRDTLARILGKATHLQIPTEVWSTSRPVPTAPVVVADEVGLLSGFYVVADLAYVGGGWQPRRLHAVIEPAAYGIPIVVGPHWQAFPDAAAIHAAGGATALPTARPASTFSETWIRIHEDPTGRSQAGLAARRVLHHGAAQRTAELLLDMLDD